LPFTDLNIKQQAREIASGFAVPGAPSSFFLPSDKPEGMERQATHQSSV
jgi:hypothetical protein